MWKSQMTTFCVCRYWHTIRNGNTSERKSSVFKLLCGSCLWAPNVVWSMRKFNLYSNFHWLRIASQFCLMKTPNPVSYHLIQSISSVVPKFVRRKHVILLFRLHTGLSNLIRYLRRRYIVFLSRHYFSYPTCIEKTSKRNLTLLFNISAWTSLQFL